MQKIEIFHVFLINAPLYMGIILFLLLLITATVLTFIFGRDS